METQLWKHLSHCRLHVELAGLVKLSESFDGPPAFFRAYSPFPLFMPLLSTPPITHTHTPPSPPLPLRHPCVCGFSSCKFFTLSLLFSFHSLYMYFPLVVSLTLTQNCRPDMIFAIDWALNANYLSIYRGWLGYKPTINNNHSKLWVSARNRAYDWKSNLNFYTWVRENGAACYM